MNYLELRHNIVHMLSIYLDRILRHSALSLSLLAIFERSAIKQLVDSYLLTSAVVSYRLVHNSFLLKLNTHQHHIFKSITNFIYVIINE